MLDPNAIREGFNQAAGCYDAHAALEQEVCARLLERCSYQRRPPRRILDLGCGTGEGSRELKRRFRRAQVMGLDSSPAMLAQLRRRSSLLKPLQPVCGDMSRLPFAARSMDLLFSSMANHWSPDPASLYDEYRRVLRPEGMLLFATLGPGTLAELFEAWAAVGGAPALAPFPDLMVIGDALMAAGFGEPVMDTERITVRYRSLDALVQELECTGISLLVRGWGRWATARVRVEAAFAPYLVEGQYPLTYEIIYGTAFGPAEGQPRRTPDGDVATFSVDSLLKSRPMS